jgi:hypothetical protein
MHTSAEVYFTTYRFVLSHTAMGGLSGGVAFTTYSVSKLFNKNICAPSDSDERSVKLDNK